MNVIKLYPLPKGEGMVRPFEIFAVRFTEMKHKVGIYRVIC